MKAPSSLGILLNALAALLFSGMSALAKVAGSSLPTSEVVFARSFVTALVLIAIHALARDPGPLLGHNRRVLLMRGLFGTAALVLYFWALPSMAVADATLLNQCAPVFVLLLAPLVLGERTDRAQLALAPVALFGAVLVLKPSLEVVNLPGLAALTSAFMGAGAYLSIRKMVHTERAHVVVLYFAVLSMLVTAPFAPTFLVPDIPLALSLIGVGLLSVGAQLTMTLAYRYDNASRVAMAGTVGPVFAGVWDALFWGRLPDLGSLIGALLIIGALVEMNRRAGLAVGGRL